MHARFQGLSAFYTAPEAEQLFATTGPVKSESDVFADQLESVTTALSEYAAEVRPIEARLKQLREDATAFVAGISGDRHWKDDGDKVEENNDLVKDVNAAVAAFWEAERACANKITALVCGTHFIADDGSGASNMYGFSEKDLDSTKELPWGSQVEESRRWWEVHHHVGSFLKGVFVDGLWGTIRGLGTLVGVDGWDAAGQAWTGLAKVVTGLAITVTPVLGTVFWALPEEKLPGWFRESRTAVKETGKALVAWDEWGKNPARAAGATTFNVVTTVFTGGAGAAAKTGSVAKVISALGKTGRLLDPVTYIAKGGKVVTVKVGDLLAGLRNVDAGARINIPEPATPAPVAGADDAARAGTGTGPDPSHTVRLPDDANGSPQYLDTNTGQLLDAAGNPKPDVMPRDVTNPDRSTGAEVPPGRSETPVQVGAREPALVGAGPGAGSIDNVAGAGTPGGVTPGAGTPGGTPGAVTPGGGTLGGGAGPGGGANNLPGGVSNHLPSGGGDLPGGGASNLPGGTGVPGGGALDGPRPIGGGNSGGDGADPVTGGRPGGDSSAGPPRDPATGQAGDGPAGGGRADSGERPGNGDTPGGNQGDGGPRPPTEQQPGSGGSGADADPVGGPDGPDASGTGNPLGHLPGVDEGRFTIGERTTSPATGRMRADQEAGLTAVLDRLKMQPQDQQRLLVQLRKSEYGQSVADFIASGKFTDTPGFRQVVNDGKQSGMIPAVHQALVHADELLKDGAKGIEFEVKLPDQGLDLDVLLRNDGEIEAGWQLKNVQSSTGIESNVKSIAKKQLRGEAGDKTAILEVHDTMTSLTDDILRSVEGAARRTNAVFELRFKDGSITVRPPSPAS
ncbi:proline-rich domain-containing protein [Streptomyces uncialis]|uniref:proline-rich domain-containing protein n=1 Tax=Streptomyces uncialis TaxID=1048205 RepID=UPI00364776A4